MERHRDPHRLVDDGVRPVTRSEHSAPASREPLDEHTVDPSEIFDPDDVDPGDEVDEYEDFDAYWAEHGTRVEIRRARICGVDVEVPTDLPLEVEVILQRRGGELTDRDLERVIDLMFGEDVLSLWISNGMTRSQFPIVCAWALANAEGRPISFAEAAEKVRESQERPTNRAERRAASRPRGSASGRSSSRTSAGSTGSRRRR
ncbi:hypothetical protein [Frankia sp. AgB32]|uniref:hypothetical protein n=1 Tax=Frankia sp. AgB32 TaxID=631119 RepID=UPI00200F7806|nr:hypothetical protein [Frankia sp. AgB32]MCK9896976.1 hypothetical protein [Frankia sp. AgB32]